MIAIQENNSCIVCGLEPQYVKSIFLKTNEGLILFEIGFCGNHVMIPDSVVQNIIGNPINLNMFYEKNTENH